MKNKSFKGLIIAVGCCCIVSISIFLIKNNKSTASDQLEEYNQETYVIEGELPSDSKKSGVPGTDTNVEPQIDENIESENEEYVKETYVIEGEVPSNSNAIGVPGTDTNPDKK